MSLGYPWSWNPMPGQGGRDVWLDGCEQVYQWKDGLMVWTEGNDVCGIRAPLVNQDIDWIDRNGARHAGVSKEERDWMYQKWGANYVAGVTDVNQPATPEQIAQARAALGRPKIVMESKPADSAGIQPAETAPLSDTAPVESSSGSTTMFLLGGALLLWWMNRD